MDFCDAHNEDFLAKIANVLCFFISRGSYWRAFLEWELVALEVRDLERSIVEPLLFQCTVLHCYVDLIVSVRGES